MTSARGVLIVGAGHAGAQAAIALRKFGFKDSILIVGAEPEPPYERPPLSKDYLAGEKSFDRLLLRPERFWTEQGIELLLGRSVVAVEPAARLVRTDDGAAFGFRSLIWAAGGTPRRLSCAGGDLAGVHVVRTRADVDLIKSEIASAEQVVVIGGGYIGLEAAAVLTKLGKQVTLLEAQDRVLGRVAGAALSRFYEAEHRARGVDLRTGVVVEGIEGDGRARVRGVRLAGGETLAADLVIVGVGIVPATGVLAAAGASVGDGVVVDEFCRTSLRDIYAIGDCAAHRSRYADGAVIRLESVQNANDQATTAARAILGDPKPYEAVPWFWSDQYDLKLQTVGLSTGHDDAILRGDPATRNFSVVYLKEGRVISLDCVNAAKDYVQGRRLVLERAAADKLLLANPAVPLAPPAPRAP